MRRALGILGLLTLAGFSGCYSADEHSPTAPAVLGAISLTVSASSIPADGVSTMQLVAAIDPGADAAHRILVFTASDGVLLGAAPGTPQKIELPVDASGHATATLRSSRTVGVVELQVQVKDLSALFARTSITFVAASPDQTITLKAGSSEAPADGATLTAITAEIAAGIPDGKRTVTFATNRGRFLPGDATTVEATPGADNRARVDLRSPDTAGEARVTARVDGVTAERSIDFRPALPEQIYVNPAKVELKATLGADGETNVTVRLVRTIGKVSPGTGLSVRVVQDDSSRAEVPVLIRNLVPSDANESVVFVLTVGEVAYRGLATIEVTVDGSAALGTAKIKIVAAS